MPNQLYTPEQAATSSIAALRYLSTLPRTVNQSMSTEFVPGRGATVNVPKPVTLSTPEARVYTKAKRDAREAIVFDELSQGFVPVKLEDQVYKAVRLPDNFLTFTLRDLEQQVIAPMAQSVVDGIVKPLVDKMTGIATEASIPAFKADGSNALAVIIAARKVLNGRKVPLSNRTFAVGGAVEAALLQVPQLQKVNEAGTDGMLREATIGRLFGFTILSAPELPEDFGVAYDRDAFASVTRVAAAPAGAGFTAVKTAEGFSMRYLQHYNPLQLEDQAVLDAFAGAEVVDPLRAVSVKVGA